MSREDFVRAVFEAVQESNHALDGTGQTSPHIWQDVKRQLVREHPRDFQRAIDVSIEYNGGVYSDDVLDQHLKEMHDEYKEHLEHNEIDRG